MCLSTLQEHTLASLHAAARKQTTAEEPDSALVRLCCM